VDFDLENINQGFVANGKTADQLVSWHAALAKSAYEAFGKKKTERGRKEREAERRKGSGFQALGKSTAQCMLACFLDLEPIHCSKGEKWREKRKRTEEREEKAKESGRRRKANTSSMINLPTCIFRRLSDYHIRASRTLFRPHWSY
jgi:hypothetical protein